jgi:CrcB protein
MFSSFPAWGQIGAVALGGMVGSVLRFFCNHFCVLWFGANFPYGTLAVNIFGSLWLGFFGGLALHKADVFDVNTRLLLTTGFAGGLTTFSSLAFETMALYERGAPMLALGNVVLNMVIGIGAIVLGLYLARML